MFFRDPLRLTVKVIFHSSNSRLPEVQQLGRAALSPAGFRLHLAANHKGPGLDVDVPLTAVSSMRAFHKKSYSSESYLIRVEYRDQDGAERMVCFEMRGFFRKARVQALAWKDLYARLKGGEEKPPAA
jgi:hypothetical protein